MRKLKSRELSLVRMVVWACLIVWMVLFMAFSVVIARLTSALSTMVEGPSLVFMVLPIWVVFTSLLIVVLIGRWASSRLGRREKEKV